MLLMVLDYGCIRDVLFYHYVNNCTDRNGGWRWDAGLMGDRQNMCGCLTPIRD